jgi:hypothetical protein
LAGVSEEVVDASDEVAFEAADRFSVAFPVAALLGEVDRGPGVVEDLGEREHVEGVVELAVAAGIEAVAVGAFGGDGDGGASGEARELRVAGEPVDPGDLADQLGCDQHAHARLGQELRRDLPDQAGQLLIEPVIARVSSRTRRIMSRAICTCTVVWARRRRCAILVCQPGESGHAEGSPSQATDRGAASAVR